MGLLALLFQVTVQKATFQWGSFPESTRRPPTESPTLTFPAVLQSSWGTENEFRSFICSRSVSRMFHHEYSFLLAAVPNTWQIKESYSSNDTDLNELSIQRRKLKEQRGLNDRGLRMTTHDDRDPPVKAECEGM